MRYLAVDLGQKRTGLAVGDALTRLVTPLEVLDIPIDRAGGAALLDAIAKAAAEQLGASPAPTGAPTVGLVFGLPLNMDGTEGPAARSVRAFAARAAARTGLPVHFQDERLSTADADWAMARSGLTRKGKKQRRDALAAAAILRDFIEARAEPR